MTPAIYGFLSVFFLIIAVLLILVILMQRGRGGGLVGAFGGPGGSSAFGAKTGDVFTIITVVMAVLFLVIGCLLAFRPVQQQPEFPAQPTQQSSTTGPAIPEFPAEMLAEMLPVTVVPIRCHSCSLSARAGPARRPGGAGSIPEGIRSCARTPGWPSRSASARRSPSRLPPAARCG